MPVNPLNPVILQELSDKSFDKGALDPNVINIKIDPASNVVTSLSATGVKLSVNLIPTLVTALSTTPPVNTAQSSVQIDTAQAVNGFVSAVWNPVTNTWVKVGAALLSDDRKTGIIVEKTASDNSIRAYINGADAGVTDSIHTSWGINANNGAVKSNASAFGLNANFQNTGVWSTAVGVTSNYSNIGDYVTGVGVNSNYQNSAGSATAVGVNANYANVGANATGMGTNANSSNTGANVSGFGSGANYQNKSDSATAVGINSNYQNTGVNATGVGSNANFHNTGANATSAGASANYENTGDNSTAVGFNSNFRNTGINNTAIGFTSLTSQTGYQNTALGAASFRASNVVSSSITSAAVDVPGNKITVPSHGFGSNGSIISLISSGTPPAPINSGNYYFYTIIDANTIGPIIPLTTNTTGTFKFTGTSQINNSTAVGYNATPFKDNQIVLGDTNVVEIKSVATVVITGVYPQFLTDIAASSALAKGQLYHLIKDPVVRQVL